MLWDSKSSLLYCAILKLCHNYGTVLYLTTLLFVIYEHYLMLHFGMLHCMISH